MYHTDLNEPSKFFTDNNELDHQLVKMKKEKKKKINL